MKDANQNLGYVGEKEETPEKRKKAANEAGLRLSKKRLAVGGLFGSKGGGGTNTKSAEPGRHSAEKHVKKGSAGGECCEAPQKSRTSSFCHRGGKEKTTSSKGSGISIGNNGRCRQT